MKIFKKTLFIVTIIIATVFTSFIIYKQIINSKPVVTIPVELINTKKEALEFAKKDTEFIAQQKNIRKNFIVGFQASFFKETGEWTVSVFAKDASDVGYGLTFTPNGKITNRYPWII